MEQVWGCCFRCSSVSDWGVVLKLHGLGLCGLCFDVDISGMSHQKRLMSLFSAEVFGVDHEALFLRSTTPMRNSAVLSCRSGSVSWCFKSVS